MTVAIRASTPSSSFLHPLVIGASEAAHFIDSRINEFALHRTETATVQITELDTIRLLNEVAEEHRVANWGGENELPITDASYFEARELISNLPAEFRTPDIMPEPNGYLAFEWRFGPFKSIIVSVNGTGKIEFAGIYGEEDFFYGGEVFNGQLPPIVFDKLVRLKLNQQ